MISGNGIELIYCNSRSIPSALQDRLSHLNINYDHNLLMNAQHYTPRQRHYDVSQHNTPWHWQNEKSAKKKKRWQWPRVVSATQHTVTQKLWLDRIITHYDIFLEIHFQISPNPHNLFRLRSILMLSFHLHLGLPSSLFLSGYTTNKLFLLHLTPATRCALIAPPPPPPLLFSRFLHFLKKTK